MWPSSRKTDEIGVYTLMKREDLKNLGLTDDQLESVMKLHGQDVESNKARYADYDELKATNDSLTKQVEQAGKDLKKLSKLTTDNEDLNKTVEDLRKAAKDAQDKASAEIQAVKLDNAINSGLSERKARNTKAVKALLDMDTIKFNEDGSLDGLTEQLDAISKDNGFLFDQGQKTDYEPTGNDKTSGATDIQAFKDQFKNALN